MVKKVKNIVSRAHVISDLNCDETVGMFVKKKLQKTNQKQFRGE